MSTGEGFTPEDQAFLNKLGKEADKSMSERERELRENSTFMQEYDEKLEGKLLENDLTVEQHLAIFDNFLDSQIKKHPEAGRQAAIEFLTAKVNSEDIGPTKKKALEQFLEKVGRGL